MAQLSVHTPRPVCVWWHACCCQLNSAVGRVAVGGWTLCLQRETMATLIAGGIAGMATWGSIYPIDVVKSIVQAMPPGTPLSQRRMMTVAAELWRRNPSRFGTYAVSDALGACQ
jgi:hypothetical protein